MTTETLTCDTTITVRDRVKSYDFPDRLVYDRKGAEACFVEGVVIGIVRMEGCDRYEIAVDRRVFRGMNEKGPFAMVYPPVNGTPSLFGGPTNGVVKV